MLVTIVCSIMLMTGLFLMLLGGVGFIQNKSFFTSAPKDVQAVLALTVGEKNMALSAKNFAKTMQRRKLWIMWNLLREMLSN
jgi:nucleoside permease NupC